MDDIRVLQHRCLLNLERRIRDFGQGRPAEERCLRLQKEGDMLRSAWFDSLIHFDSRLRHGCSAAGGGQMCSGVLGSQAIGTRL